VDTITFLRLILDKNLSWGTCVIRFSRPFLSLETLRMVYYSIAHSVMSYGIIFWGGSTHSKTILKTQKRIIQIITNSGSRVSCRNLFKKLSIFLSYHFSPSTFIHFIHPNDQYSLIQDMSTYIYSYKIIDNTSITTSPST
jgi:hypothetical protein